MSHGFTNDILAIIKLGWRRWWRLSSGNDGGFQIKNHIAGFKSGEMCILGSVSVIGSRINCVN